MKHLYYSALIALAGLAGCATSLRSGPRDCRLVDITRVARTTPDALELKALEHLARGDFANCAKAFEASAHQSRSGSHCDGDLPDRRAERAFLAAAECWLLDGDAGRATAMVAESLEGGGPPDRFEVAPRRDRILYAIWARRTGAALPYRLSQKAARLLAPSSSEPQEDSP